MLKFCETEARKNIDCVLGLRKQVEEIVDAHM